MEEEKKDERMVLLHGFNNQEAVAIMRAVKSVIEDPQGVAFSVTTPTNIQWQVGQLIREVREEHEYMKKNPPSTSP